MGSKKTLLLILLVCVLAASAYYVFKDNSAVQTHIRDLRKTASRMPAKGLCARRGLARTHPENTLAAFKEAARLGCHMVNLSVRLSSDGQPVVIHDATLERTTNGKGPVANVTLEQLKTLDAGSWKDKRFRNERIPSLAEVLTAIPNNIWLLISPDSARSADVVVSQITEYRKEHQVIVCTDEQAAMKLGSTHPGIFICITLDPSRPLKEFNDIIDMEPEYVFMEGPLPEDLSNKTAALAESEILTIYSGANTPDRLRKLLDAGVGFVVTDNFRALMKTSAEYGIQPLETRISAEETSSPDDS